VTRAEAGELPRLHVVTDDATLADPGWLSRARAVVEAGGAGLALHVRGPRTPGRVMHDLVRALRGAADRFGAGLVVNDRVDVAIAAEVPWVHLGGRSLPAGEVRRIAGPEMRIGVSCHDEAEMLAVRAAEVAYGFAGPVFPTASHPGTEGRGVAWAAAMVRAAGPLPVVAIGGVRPSTVRELRDAGCAGVAVLRGVWNHADPVGAVAAYIEVLNSGVQGADRPSPPDEDEGEKGP
jgi:thiamine-phosphate diphosphorylase